MGSSDCSAMKERRLFVAGGFCVHYSCCGLKRHGSRVFERLRKTAPYSWVTGESQTEKMPIRVIFSGTRVTPHGLPTIRSTTHAILKCSQSSISQNYKVTKCTPLMFCTVHLVYVKYPQFRNENKK